MCFGPYRRCRFCDNARPPGMAGWVGALSRPSGAHALPRPAIPVPSSPPAHRTTPTTLRLPALRTPRRRGSGFRRRHPARDPGGRRRAARSARRPSTNCRIAIAPDSSSRTATSPPTSSEASASTWTKSSRRNRGAMSSPSTRTTTCRARTHRSRGAGNGGGQATAEVRSAARSAARRRCFGVHRWSVRRRPLGSGTSLQALPRPPAPRLAQPGEPLDRRHPPPRRAETADGPESRPPAATSPRCAAPSSLVRRCCFQIAHPCPNSLANPVPISVLAAPHAHSARLHAR